MAKVTLSINSFVDVALPAGVTAGRVLFSVSDADGLVDSAQSDGPEVVFADIAPGTYTATVVRLDAQGDTLGDAASAEFVVPEVTFAQPASLTVTIG